jgi:hypothetical protein
MLPNLSDSRKSVEGRLPRGFGLKRLVDLPMAWPDQWHALRTERTRFGADIALADLLVALSSCERRADFSRPCGARFTDLTSRTAGRGISPWNGPGVCAAGRRKPREYRAILWRRKSCQDARTTWWRTQSRRTGLHRANSLLTGKRTGYFSFLGSFGENCRRKHTYCQPVTNIFPKNRNREIIRHIRERCPANRVLMTHSGARKTAQQSRLERPRRTLIGACLSLSRHG